MSAKDPEAQHFFVGLLARLIVVVSKTISHVDLLTDLKTGELVDPGAIASSWTPSGQV